MCDRYSFALSKEKLARRFQVKVHQVPALNYNIPPDSIVPVIIHQTSRQLLYCQWGLSPVHTGNKKRTRLIHSINTATVAKQPYLYKLLQTQRCLIPADGFYVWHRLSRKSQVPYRVVLKWNLPFAFAGIWESYSSATEAGTLQSACSLFTIASNELLSRIHLAMPVILPMELESEWLNQDLPVEEVLKMMAPYPADKMNCFPVSTQVNNPAFNSPVLLKAVQASDQFGNYILFD